MKDFQHRDKWFVIYPSKAPDWGASGYAVHVPNHLAKDVTTHYYYIQSEDTLWQISSTDLLEKRKLYNGRYHIDRDYLEKIEITDEWRKQIESYGR